MPEKKIDPNAALAEILKRMLAGGAADQNYDKPITALAPVDQAPATSTWAAQPPQGWGGPSRPDEALAERFANLDPPADPFAAQSEDEKRLTDPDDVGYRDAHYIWTGQRWRKPTPFAR